MTCKHVDILAVAVLLLGLALFSKVRYTAPMVVLHKQTVTTPFGRSLVVLPTTVCSRFSVD